LYFLLQSKFHSFVNYTKKLSEKKKRKKERKKTRKKKLGEELLGSQARWRVIPRPYSTLLSPPGERLFDPQAILE